LIPRLKPFWLSRLFISIHFFPALPTILIFVSLTLIYNVPQLYPIFVALFQLFLLFFPVIVRISPPRHGTADAIMGVSLFSEAAPDDFGAFDRSFLTLFRVLAGQPWVEALPFVQPDGGSNATVCVKFMGGFGIKNRSAI
jgi:hypothetical protein